MLTDENKCDFNITHVLLFFVLWRVILVYDVNLNDCCLSCELDKIFRCMGCGSNNGRAVYTAPSFSWCKVGADVLYNVKLNLIFRIF